MEIRVEKGFGPSWHQEVAKEDLSEVAWGTRSGEDGDFLLLADGAGQEEVDAVLALHDAHDPEAPGPEAPPTLEERIKKLALAALDETFPPAEKDAAKAELVEWAKGEEVA